MVILYTKWAVYFHHFRPPTRHSTTFRNLFALHRWFSCLHQSPKRRRFIPSFQTRFARFCHSLVLTRHSMPCPSSASPLSIAGLRTSTRHPCTTHAPVHDSHTLARASYAPGSVPLPRRAFHLCCYSLGILLLSCCFFNFSISVLCGIYSPSLFHFSIVLLWRLFTYKDCYSLMTDPILISAMPLPPSTVLNGCLCYQVKVFVVLKDISRVMSLFVSFALRVGIGLRDLRTSCP